MPRRHIGTERGFAKLKPIYVLIIDEHSLVRAGLRLLIETHSSVKVIGDAAGGGEAVRIAARAQPDVILVNLDMEAESGLDIFPDLLRSAGTAKIIALTGGRDSDVQHEAVRAGARGIVMKDQAVDVLIKAIEKVHAGELWLDRKMTARLVDQLSRPRIDDDPEVAKIATLTAREKEIIAVACQGLRNREVAKRLFISEITVRHHLTSIYSKLGLTDRFELALYAFRRGLAQPPS
jgi:two-component system nitrate/nitrite response regulator NarL